VNTYAIWVDLIDGSEDLEFAKAIHVFLDHFKLQGMVVSYTLERRKFGFGPEGLGEFHVRIQTETLDQLDLAFHQAATRSGEIEQKHSALYRSFPDAVRER
jgi:hypothetical protein